MKAHYRTANGRLTFEVTGETVKQVFSEISKVQEVFDAESECGCCKSKDLKFMVRHVDDFEFYELACGAPDCRAQFSFGQAKKGGALFPKRKDEDGRWLPNRGWAKYVPKGGVTAAPPAKTAADGIDYYPDDPF